MTISWKVRSGLVVAVLLAFTSAACGDDKAFRYPVGKHGPAELQYVNGLPVLTVGGTPKEIGEQIALLGTKPASRLVRYPKEVLEASVTRKAARLVWPRLIERGKAMVERFPAAYRDELEAIAQSSRFDREMIVAGNTLFDLKNDVGALFGCSVLIVEANRSLTNQPLFGRNLDFPTLGYLHEYSLVMVYKPKDKRSFVSVGFPGLVGCLSGINDAGLSLAVLEVAAPKEKIPFDPEGLPYAICYRDLLENCTTVDEAEKRLRSLRRATTSNLAICDKNGGAVFEITPTKVVRRAADKGLCPCTNHFCTQELKEVSPIGHSSSRDRFEKLIRSGATDRLGLEDVHRCLDAVNLGQNTLQTMIFEPATMKLHLAIGKSPSSAFDLKVLDLSMFFQK